MISNHEGKEKFFRRIIEKGALRHSYFFFGDEGVGKKFFALRLANFLENGKFEFGSPFFIDTKIFEPQADEPFGISVALAIRSFLWETPLKSARRFAIVDGAGELTFEAQSALLKVVEESPEFSLIVFIAKNAEVFLPPLTSRLTKIHFGRLPDSDLSEILVSDYGIDKKKASDIARVSFGRIGRALRMLDKNGGAKQEITLLSKIREREAALRSEGALKNFKKLKLLVAAEEILNRYNLNEGLQKKALEYKLGFNL